MGERLSHVDISWAAVVVAFVAAVASLFSRRLLPEAGRDHGKVPIFFLLLSVLLRAAAVPVEAWDGHPIALLALKLAAAISLTAGMVGVLGSIVFDLLLLRVGIRVPTILRDMLLVIAFVIALLSIIRQSGANLVSLLTTSGVLIAVIGLALQEPIANMFAGLSLQLDRTIAVGDWIKIDGRIGRIDRISFRATSIITRDDDTVTLPNRWFMQNPVQNYSRPHRRHRIYCDVGFHYRHAPNQVKQVLLEALRGCTGVLERPAPEVVVHDFADSYVRYSVLYFIRDFARDVQIDGEVKTRIWYAAQRAGLELPFPLRTVMMHTVTEESKRAGEEREFLERLGALAKVELFQALDDTDVEHLARGMKRRLFAGGEALVRQGAPGDSLFLIAQGHVTVVLEVDGAEREVARLGPGDLLGELSLMTGEARTATCVARTDVVAHEVGYEAMQALLAQKPKLAEDLSAILSERQTRLEAEREGLSVEAASTRKAETKRRLLGRMRSFFHLG